MNNPENAVSFVDDNAPTEVETTGRKVVNNLQEVITTEEEIPTDEASVENVTPLTGALPTEGTDGDEDDEADLTADDSDGKLGVDEVNRIVKKRVEHIRSKTRRQVEAERQEEIEFWQERAKAQKVESQDFILPPKPSMRDYASAPDQFEVDLIHWTNQKAMIDQHKGSIQAKYAERVNVFAKDHPDFQKSVSFFQSVTVPPALEAAVLASPNGPQVAYFLSKNFKEFNRISSITDPLTMVYELAKVELQVTGAVKTPPVVVAVKPAFKAMKTVQSNGGVGKPIKTPQELAAAGDKQALIEARKKAHQNTGWTSGR